MGRRLQALLFLIAFVFYRSGCELAVIAGQLSAADMMRVHEHDEEDGDLQELRVGYQRDEGHIALLASLTDAVRSTLVNARSRKRHLCMVACMHWRRNVGLNLARHV